MKKLYVSYPLKDLTYEEFLKTRELIKFKTENFIEEPLKLVDSLEEADIVYFADGWKKSKVCKIEHGKAKRQKLDIIEEKTWVINIKKLIIAILTAILITLTIVAIPSQAQQKTYGDIYTYEYVYNNFGRPILNSDHSNVVTRVRHSINTIDEYEYWLNNNFNHNVFIDND